MTPTDAVKLTGYIQAHFPSQPINEFTPDALWELLADYPAADCKAAVLAISKRGDGDRTKWCAPADVAAEVRRIRTKRLNDNPLPSPPPDLSPIETIAWQADATRRTADGEIVETTGYGELQHRPTARALGMAGSSLPEEDMADSARRRARQAASDARREAQAARKPEPEPLLGPDDHSREPTPPEPKPLLPTDRDPAAVAAREAIPASQAPHEETT